MGWFYKLACFRQGILYLLKLKTSLMNPIVKSTAIKFGGILASISILYTLTAYLVDESLFVNMWMGLLLILLIVILPIVATIQARKKMDGFISFKDAFSTYVITWSISAVASALMNILLFHIIDPELASRVVDASIESTIRVMEQFGAPEEAIQQSMDRMNHDEMMETYTIGKQIQGMLIFIVVGSVIGLIVAAITKKNPPVFDTFDSSAEQK